MRGPIPPFRILHVAPYSPAAWAYGGIPRVVAGMLDGLHRRGHAVELCSTDVCDASTRLGDVRGTRPAWRILPNVSNGAAFHLQAFAPRGLRRFLTADLHRFDLVHLHACHNVLTVRTAQHCAARGIPFVLSPNGTAPITERRRTWKRVFRTLTRDRSLEEAARVFAVSQAEAGDLRGLGLRDAAVAVIPNPVEMPPANTRPSNGFLRSRLTSRIDASIVLFLGKVTPRKHVGSLVEAMALLAQTDVHLVIAGSDQGGLREALTSAAAMRLGERLHLVGVLREGERFAALADADVVAYPSAGEAFGLVACEALSCGTPVVVGGDGGCGEVVRATGGGLTVDPGSPHALAGAIESILAGRETWRASAAAAGSRVRREFSSDRVAALLEQHYAEVIGHQTGRSA